MNLRKPLIALLTTLLVTTAAPARAAAGDLILVQLSPTGWQVATSQLSALYTNVVNSNSQALQLLAGINLSALAGQVCIDNANVQLQNQTMAGVLAIPGVSASVGGVPCLKAGVYLQATGTGNNAELVVTVVGASPNGAIKLLAGTNPSKIPLTSAAGVAVNSVRVQLGALAIGRHLITASYSGDALNVAAESNELTYDVLVPTGSTPISTAAQERIVTLLHTGFFGVAPSDHVKVTLANALANGALTPVGLATQWHAETPEASAIIRLYFSIFRRIPDFGGLNYWLAVKRSGANITNIAEAMAVSPEFMAAYNGLSDEQYVNRVYVNVMGRTAEPAGLAYHVARLSRGMSRGSFVIGFSDSPEYIALTLGDAAMVRLMGAIVGRMPTIAETDAAGNAIEAGTLTVSNQAKALVESGEFVARVVGP